MVPWFAPATIAAGALKLSDCAASGFSRGRVSQDHRPSHGGRFSHDLPLALLGLVRAYAMQGNTAASRSEYEKLWELWKDSDPGLPAKRDASVESARLH